VSFIQKQAEAGQLNGLTSQLQALINFILCYVGLPPDTFLVDASFLDCSTSTAQSRTPGWLRALASLVTPKPLYATMLSGGIGGLATEFSPFGPVDTELRMAGGVGGTATEFQHSPVRDSTVHMTNPRINSQTVDPCTSVAPGASVPPECRPVMALRTAQGTILQNVPVGWGIGTGGGSIAAEAPTTQSCGVFGSTAATTTNARGAPRCAGTWGTTDRDRRAGST
jgi:hypothetical protein